MSQSMTEDMFSSHIEKLDSLLFSPQISSGSTSMMQESLFQQQIRQSIQSHEGNGEVVQITAVPLQSVLFRNKQTGTIYQNNIDQFG